MAASSLFKLNLNKKYKEYINSYMPVLHVDFFLIYLKFIYLFKIF